MFMIRFISWDRKQKPALINTRHRMIWFAYCKMDKSEASTGMETAGNYLEKHAHRYMTPSPPRYVIPAVLVL